MENKQLELFTEECNHCGVLFSPDNVEDMQDVENFTNDIYCCVECFEKEEESVYMLWLQSNK